MGTLLKRSGDLICIYEFTLASTTSASDTALNFLIDNTTRNERPMLKAFKIILSIAAIWVATFSILSFVFDGALSQEINKIKSGADLPLETVDKVYLVDKYNYLICYENSNLGADQLILQKNKYINKTFSQMVSTKELRSNAIKHKRCNPSAISNKTSILSRCVGGELQCFKTSKFYLKIKNTEDTDPLMVVYKKDGKFRFGFSEFSALFSAIIIDAIAISFGLLVGFFNL